MEADLSMVKGKTPLGLWWYPSFNQRCSCTEDTRGSPCEQGLYAIFLLSTEFGLLVAGEWNEHSQCLNTTDSDKRCSQLCVMTIQETKSCGSAADIVTGCGLEDQGLRVHPQ
jgi:hypothetical protein